MTTLKEQVNPYVANQGIRRQFMNLYRLIKTHSLLNSLFLADTISRDTYSLEVKQTLEKINILKGQLQRYDVRRFCELWGIQTQYASLGKMNEIIKSDIKVGIGVARIANMLPQINEDAYSAQTYGDVHESLSRFCLELLKMKQTQKGITPTFKKCIDDLIAIQFNFSQKYQRLNDPLDESSKDLLKESLIKFRVEYQKVYRF